MSLETDRPSRPPSESAGETRTTDETALSRDEIFHILQTSRRREAIRFMLERDGAVKMRDVAEHVAALEHETTIAGLTSTQRQRVYIPLYQSHLPTLDEEGVVEYEKQRGIVRPTDRLELFRPYLELDADASDSRPDPSRSRSPGWDRVEIGAVTSASLLLGGAIGTLAATTTLESSPILAAVVGALSLAGLAAGTLFAALFASLALTGTSLDDGPSRVLERAGIGSRADRDETN